MLTILGITGRPISRIAQLTNAFTNIYTVSQGCYLTITLLHVANTTAGAINLRLCFVASGGTPTVANAQAWDVSIAANSFTEFGKWEILNGSTGIFAMASANTSLTFTLSAIEA